MRRIHEKKLLKEKFKLIKKYCIAENLTAE